MTGMAAPWLAIIDMQRIFADPGSGWATPGFAAIVEPVNRLVAAAGDRRTFTRFLAPPEPAGAWSDYYRQWPFALQPADAPIYQLVDDLHGTGEPTIDACTFSKWTPELAARVGPDAALVLAGVSTDCCVLSTAVAAADAGVHVQVVSDACAGVDESSHRQALHILSLYQPIITVVTVDQAIAGWPR